MVHNSIALPMSAMMSIGRRRRRSIHTPANRLKTSPGATLPALISDIWKGVAFNTVIAVNEIAPISVPKTEIV